jgi:hypothetical protein
LVVGQFQRDSTVSFVDALSIVRVEVAEDETTRRQMGAVRA